MKRHIAQQQTADPRRGGAVIILSLSLLMTLLFLGLFFFAFIDDESLSADIYAKQFQGDSGITGNAEILNHALDQAIVGTNDSDPTQKHYARYSVLAGGQYSLLAHILGRIGEHDWDRDGTLDAAEDLNGNGYLDPWAAMSTEPFSGSGIRVYYDDSTMQFVASLGDVDRDGTPDFINDLTNLHLNGSELAGGTWTRFEPNPGYTYPDLNSFFLYHQQADPTTGQISIKPSFDAPGVLYAPELYLSQPNLVARDRVLRLHSGYTIGGAPRYVPVGSSLTALSGDTTRPIAGMDAKYLVDAPPNLGVWTGSLNDYSSLHVDADNDGEVDSWLLDLDHPLITFSDGRQAVPLYFFKIEDLDALINLNTAGDMPLYRIAERATSPVSRAALLDALLNDSRFLTGSNFGYSLSEINPGVALMVDPSDPLFIDTGNQQLALDQYRSYFDEQAGIGSASMDRLTLANTELLWLMTGRHQYDENRNVLPPSNYDVAGRYGERRLLDANAPFLPAAGSTTVDDDRDSNTGRRSNAGATYLERFHARNGAPVTQPVRMPPAVHPLDATGYGVAYQLEAGAGMKQIKRKSTNLNEPGRWSYYNALMSTPFGDIPMWQYAGTMTAAAGVSPWATAMINGTPNFLQAVDTSNLIDALIDEPDELVLDDSDANFPNPDDQPFGAVETTALHASNSDWSSLARTSRVRQLAPVNFDINYAAAQIRKRFTVMSWDRPELGFARDPNRPWEFNDDADSPEERFPPRFGAITASRHENGASGANISAQDPIRPEVRRLLTIDFEGTTPNSLPQHPLLLNGILSDDSMFGGGGPDCFDNNGNPRFRPLVPHPVFNSASDGSITPPAMIHSNSAPRAYPFPTVGADKAAQEWWARYDRQRLARDIYTLLWFMGSPVDAVNANPYAALPDLDGDGIPDVIKEMAQFAVNVVDAMDHDNVVTRFEYDPDLSNGWTWTSGTDPVVYGVEAQTLTFSEVLWTSTHVENSMGDPADHLATLYDDANGDKHFLFIELRNAMPFQVNLGRDSFRIRRLGAATPELTFDNAGTVGPGQNYIIGTHSGGFNVVGGTSDGAAQAAIFWLDHQHDQANPNDLSYTAAIPYLPPVGGAPAGTDAAAARQAYPQPLCDLDLCHNRDRSAQRFTQHASSVGYFIEDLAASWPPPVEQFQLVLERRQNMQGDGCIATASNDWVEVDRVTVRHRTLAEDLQDTTTFTDVQNRFRSNVVSQERREPFFAHTEVGSAALNPSQPGDGVIDYGAIAGVNGFYRHSLGGPDLTNGSNDPMAQSAPQNALKHQRNSVLPEDASASPPAYQFQITQPHFDRGFTSIYDLLSVLTIGPSELVFRDRTTSPPEGGLVQAGLTRLQGINTAGIRFQNPQPAPQLPGHISGIPGMAGRHFENRWYRLLGLLAVPSHTSDEIADQMTLRRRIPGRVNLNTLRHEEVFGAVINDMAQIRLLHGPSGERPTDDLISTAPSRNWYDELRRSRDGQDGGGNILPPGTPYARPFRPATYDNPDFDNAESNRAIANNPADDTLLRMGRGGYVNIGLLEARDPSDIGNDEIDYHTRQRILSKINNLTTNRSHVYVIFAGFQLHAAHDRNSSNPNDPHIQIGGRLDESEFPTYRELLVVDMSRLEEAYDRANESFQFESFIIHREVLP